VPGYDRIRDRAPGVFHEVDAVDTISDCQPIGLRHLGGGEQLDHCGATLSAQPKGHNCQSAGDSRGEHRGGKKANA
jgi:hypothetical protein